jgi:hypothetical protein
MVTGSRWARWSSVFEPSDGAATHWRPPEEALSFLIGTRVVGAFGLLRQAALNRPEYAIPRSAERT